MDWIIQSSFSMQSYAKQLSLFYDQYQSFIPPNPNLHKWKEICEYTQADTLSEWGPNEHFLEYQILHTKNIVSHSSHPIPLHPTQSHHWCFNVETYCIYFWYRNNDEPKKLPGVDGRGLGWSRWDPSHSNPTPIPPGPIVQNCPFCPRWCTVVVHLLSAKSILPDIWVICRKCKFE